MVQILSHFGQLQIAYNTIRSKQQREGAASQSSKVVSWLNSVLVAPTRLARQNCALTPPQAKCSPFWAVGKHGAAERVCRANKDGATILLCRANGNGATKGICHATKSKMQSFLDFDTPWRGSVALSRQQHWRDKPRSPICSPFWSGAVVGEARLFCRATHTGTTRHLLPAVCFKFVSLNPS